MSIATSIEKLSETLTNCKTNLKEKGVEADNIKISDVDEKIAEIQAGSSEGSGKFANVTSYKVEGVENLGEEWLGGGRSPHKNENVEIKTDVKVYNLHLLYIKDSGESEDPTEIVDTKLQRDPQDNTKWTGTYTGDIKYEDWHSYTSIILGAKNNGSYKFEVLYSCGFYRESE